MADPCAERNRLGKCEVCDNNGALYSCPRCELKTCSLACVKIHKKELNCNGDRDKTAFVPISRFDNLTVLSDYRFLEDISQTIDNCKRNPQKRYTRFNNPLPPHLFRLKNEAMKRKTRLQFIPQHFTRHKENTTFLNFGTRVIHWRVEFIFPQANSIKIVEERCDEDERLSTVLSKYIEFDSCPDLYKNHLRFYHSTGISGLEVLLKAENVVPSPSFFALDMFSSLKENFENRLILEFPVIYVIQKTHKEEYNILDPDLELQSSSNMKNALANFKPFNYYDTISYFKNENSTYASAASSIHSSANELKKYFGYVEDCEGGEKDEEKVEEKNRREKKIYIPQYEDLVKQ